ncbi:MAG: FtsX-like permease family protein [Cyclobacteriaceae bacterium]
MKRSSPPSFAERFFASFCHTRHLEGLEGDLYELFERRVESKGIWLAKLLYLFDMTTLMRSSVAKPIKRNRMTNNLGMFKNYFKTTLRMGWKRKGFSFINLFGLTIGLTSVIFITLFVQDELSYDRLVTDAGQKFRMYNVRQDSDGSTNYLPIVPPMYGVTLREEFPQVKQVGRVLFDYGGTVFNVENQPFSEKGGFFAEPQVLDILDVKVKEGSFHEDMEPISVLLSETLFKKFFGDAVFEEQTLVTSNITVKVAGIFQDFPEQSHLDAHYIFPFELLRQYSSTERLESWIWQQFFTYVELEPQANQKVFIEQFGEQVRELSREQTAAYGFQFDPHLQPVREIHLHSTNFQWDIAKTESFQSILFLSIAAGIILLIACLNFINLSTAQAMKRSKEVSVRKFIGANRGQLLIQYGFESTIYTFIAGIVSLILFILFLTPFNTFTGKVFTLEEILNIRNITLFFGSLLILGILSGWYPAVVLTRFNPLSALRGRHGSKKVFGSNWKLDPRQLMVGAQYILSISLISISLIMQSQYSFLRNTDMGFNKENLIWLPLTTALENDLSSTRESFLSHNQVKEVSFCYGVPGGIVAGDGVFLPRKQDTEFSTNMFMVDHDYLSIMNIDVVAGRGFSKDFSTDPSSAFVINETAVENFGFSSPEEALGETVHWTTWTNTDSLKKGKIIGVVNDFNFKSLHNQISSVVLHMGESYFQNMIIRLGEDDPLATLEFLEDQYRKYEPTRPFEPQFVDSMFAEFYESENKLSKLFTLFTILAILTATIGLFGLVSYSIVSRAKEISIRKVLGAGTKKLISLLVMRYIWLVLICIAVAFPVSYWLANMWLDNFAYRIDVGPEIFVPVAFAMIFLTLLTVGFQAIKGSMANPAEKLRSE